jgi:hypothetical protein
VEALNDECLVDWIRALTFLFVIVVVLLLLCPADEINQGLDERNERLVFSRIVANSCRRPEADDPTDHSGQYFLITPKLLPNLEDMANPGIQPLIVLNGTLVSWPWLHLLCCVAVFRVFWRLLDCSFAYLFLTTGRFITHSVA